MKAKRILRSCIAAALLPAFFLALSGCRRHTIKHLVYTDDYPSIYEAELHQIFGDYTLGDRRARHIEGEDCDCGYHQDTVDCWEWSISYTDAKGYPMHCTLNNRQSLYEQQVEWMADQIETHFYNNYVLRDFDGLLADSGCYCFCFIGRVCGSVSNCDWEQQCNVNTCTNYLELLKEREQPTPLSSLNYAELFDRYPMNISIQIRLKSQDTQRFAGAVELLNTMTGQIAEEIGTNLNLKATVHINGGPEDTIYYLCGEIAEFSDVFDFEHAVFRSYKGKFW